MAEFNPLRDPILGNVKEVEAKSFGVEMVGEENYFSMAMNEVDHAWAYAGSKMSLRGEYLRKQAIEDIMRGYLSYREFIKEVT
jgi:hypothetical protein